MFRKIICLPAILLLAFTGSANAALLTTLAISDATLYDLDGNGSFLLPDPNFEDAFIRPFGRASRGVWEFDLAGIAAGATINSASVAFSRQLGSTTPGDMLLYGFAGDGVAGNSDGNQTANPIGTFTLSGTNQIYNVGLNQSVVQNLIDNATSYLGILMVSSNQASGGPGGDICSLEYNAELEQLNGPCSGAQLTLDFTPSTIPAVPLPAAVWLFGTALVAMFGYGRLRRAS